MSVPRDWPRHLQGRWPVVRALLLAIGLGFHGLAAAPLPHVVTRDDLKNPVTVEEVSAWARRLTQLGYAISPEELGEHVITVSGWIGGAHKAVLAPARPVFRFAGTNQGWALFANPDTHPARLQIRVRRSGRREFEVLFQHLDAEHDWWAETLTYRRLRGVYDAGGYRSKPRGPYKRFSRWVGQRVLDEIPEVTTVEIRTLRTHTTLPGEPPDPKVEVRHVVTVERTP